MSAYLGTSSVVSSTGDVTLSVAGSAVSGLASGAVVGSLTGESFSSSRAGMYVKSGGQCTVFLPLLNAIFLNSDKMFPLCRLKDDLELQVLLESMIRSVVADNSISSAWTITAAELILEMIELSDSAQEIVNSYSPPGQQVCIHSNEWRYFTNTLPANTSGSYSALVSARFNS